MPRQALIDHLKANALRTDGPFTLRSGAVADWYIDARQTTFDGVGALYVGEAVLSVLRPEVVGVGGMTMGADPIATAVLHQGAARGLAYDAFVVRKEPKDHGRGKQVEGPDVTGRRVIVLEDTSTTGGSPLKAIAALRAVGAEVADVAVVVDRDTGAREVIEAAGVPYLAAIGLKDLGLS